MIDNRGHEVPLCSRSVFQRDIPPRVRRVVGRAEMGSKRYAISFAAGLFGMAVIVMVGALVLRLSFFRDPMLLVSMTITMLFLGVVTMISGMIGRTGREALAREAILSIGRCPSCAYELRGATIEHDGCTVCPECGAAWRIPARDDVPSVN